MSDDQLLDAATDCAVTIHQLETKQFRVAYQRAILHSPDRLDPKQSALPGREQPRRYGGDGTPWVSEFAAVELGARVGRTTHAARQSMADAEQAATQR